MIHAGASEAQICALLLNRDVRSKLKSALTSLGGPGQWRQTGPADPNQG